MGADGDMSSPFGVAGCCCPGIRGVVVSCGVVGARGEMCSSFEVGVGFGVSAAGGVVSWGGGEGGEGS